MNTKILDYFIAIAEEKSITKAAERFFLTDSALSKHVRNMEKNLGAPIFFHGREGMQLTPEGMIFINNAQAIRHLEKEMERKLSGLNTGRGNTITVAVDDTYYNCIIRDIMPVFQQEYPDFMVELLKCNSIQARKLLLGQRADFAIMSALTARVPELESMRVMSSTAYCVYPPGFPDAKAPGALKRALEQGLMPVLHPMGNTIRMLEEQRLIEMKLQPEKILEGNFGNALNEVLNGAGIGFLPEGICELYRQKNLSIGDPFMLFYTLITYVPNSVFSPQCRALMELMLRVISGGGLLTPYRAVNAPAARQ